MPPGELTWSNGGTVATIEMHDVPVIDQPKWPAHGARISPARLSFKMIFEATDTAINYDDKAKRFRVMGFLATCRMEARVVVPHVISRTHIPGFPEEGLLRRVLPPLAEI